MRRRAHRSCFGSFTDRQQYKQNMIIKTSDKIEYFFEPQRFMIEIIQKIYIYYINHNFTIRYFRKYSIQVFGARYSYYSSVEWTMWFY